ncbi:MAG: galactose mutarotase [Candidatus Symbiothrix sp.]|jgi:aldose 1-epimerase|nr:galactose mutarotase [Candidatus Symbiothrix sp.]
MNTANFEKIVDGKQVRLYTLSNSTGSKVEVINWGGKIVSIQVPDKNGKLVDVVLGKSNIDDYMNDQEPYFGAICGRVANRIANGKFTLDGKDYTLAVNNGPNALHGGIKGFNSVVWDAKQIDNQTLELTYFAKDGEEGYPGNLTVTVTYHLTDTNAVEITYRATTDKTTILNLTNHSYFNLSGEGDPYVGDHELQINAGTYLPTNDVAIPLGNPEKVEGTPFDFRSIHTIGERIDDDNQQLTWGNGYDHTYIVNKAKEGDTGFVAKAQSPKTGITLEVYSTEPGIQLYTANWLDGSFVGKNGHTYPKRSAFCLETHHYPDSIHHPEYPTTVLKPGEVFLSKTVFAFK